MHIKASFSDAEASRKMTAINEYFQNLDRWRDHKIYTSGIFPTTGLSASDYKMIMQVLIRTLFRRSDTV